MSRSLAPATRALLVALVLTAATTGCTNPETEEGQVGYIEHVPLIFGERYLVGTQTGPASTGLVWRQYVTNVDVRPKNFAEGFHILSSDNLNVGFEAHARISIRGGDVQALVEHYGSGDPMRIDSDHSAPEWYVRTVRQPFRTAIRDVVHRYDAYDIQAKTQEIGGLVLSRLQELYADTPIQFETMSIGNLSYPAEINAEIQRKLAAEQDLERMERELQIAQQEANIMVANSRGRANAQRIVNETLTPMYVQHEALEGVRRLSQSPRARIILSPTGSGGGTPVILNLGQ